MPVRLLLESHLNFQNVKLFVCIIKDLRKVRYLGLSTSLQLTQIISFSWLHNISIINVSKSLYPSICWLVVKLLLSLVFANIVAMSIKVLISNYKNQMSSKKNLGNPKICFSIKYWEHWSKLFLINMLKTLEIKQKLVTTQEESIEKNGEI